MAEKIPAVYAAISAVQAALAKEGISKQRKNAQQGYSFRGIDDVYAALAPLLAKHGLLILPRVLSRTCTERQTQRGGALFSVVLDVEFDFVAASDGSKCTIRTVGEAMDSADKASNKAMSAAYKYAAFMAFCVPTEGDNDADATTHTVAAVQVTPNNYDLNAALEAILAAPDSTALDMVARDLWKRAPASARDAIKAARDERMAAFDGGKE